MTTEFPGSTRQTRNFVISGTTLWNPGDDFVREGVIHVLRQTFPGDVLNFQFYNFAEDQFPKSKFRGIGNELSAGDLDQCRDSIDGVIIAGLSAGHEIKDLYQWVIANGLEDRVFLMGAGYENSYCAGHVLEEPEATVFRNARLIIGRTARHPAQMDGARTPYVHLNCPALLSVPEVKQVPQGKKIERIGFSIQLPHEVGIVNQTCGSEIHRLACELMLDLARTHQVELVAHHKSEYFAFLKQLRGTGIPVVYSSFHRDLHDAYRSYDCVITTRLHSSLYANGHGIPGIIVNDTDRHTHALDGFHHSAWVNSRAGCERALASLKETDLATVATHLQTFKAELTARYMASFRQAFESSPSAEARSQSHELESYQFNSEIKEQRLVRSIVKPGMTVLDVGAHLGKYTKLFSLLVGSEGRVYSFEPTPSTAALLGERVQAENLTNVTLINQAVCDQDGWVTLHQFPEQYSSWNGLGRPAMEDPSDPSKLVPHAGTTNVAATTLDQFCQARGLDHIDYLKLDVEGAEIHALQGAAGLLRRQAITHLQFEISRNMLQGLGTRARDVFDLLNQYGYECHAIGEEGQIGPVCMDSDAFYDNYVAFPIKAARPACLPIHFFTIVLNGQPYLRHHIEVLRQLPFPWQWHIVEGVADLKHDTAWSTSHGGHVPPTFHRDGLSVDGTTEYLDALQGAFPDQVKIYRTADGTFWDGKREMVNAPLLNIEEECLLWQLDADELWSTTQIIRARALFLASAERTAAFFFCHYFVGPDRVVTSRDTYGNNSAYEWLRVWRFQPGDRWVAHEPPQLVRQRPDEALVDVGSLCPFRQNETEAMGLVFQHFAYASEAQVRFKEDYYGYRGAVEQWKRMQESIALPCRLADYFGWVTDDAMVDSARAQNLTPCVALPSSTMMSEPPVIAPDRSVQQLLWVRLDSIGDAVLASSMLPWVQQKFPEARITILCQTRVAELYLAAPMVSSVIAIDSQRAHDASHLKEIVGEIAQLQPQLILNSTRSRDTLSDHLTLAFPNARHIALESDANNQSEADRTAAAGRYTELIPSGENRSELEHHLDFLTGLGATPMAPLQPVVWTSSDDEALADAYFESEGLNPAHTIALFPGAQFDVRVYPAFVKALAGLDAFQFLIFGDASQTELATGMAERLGGRARVLCGRSTLLETAALLRRCRLYIGAESAGAHLACAVGVANVVVLGGGHFGRFMPYSALTSAVSLPLACYGCDWRCAYSRAHCIKDLSPAVLAEAIRQTLTSTSFQPRLFLESEPSWNSAANLPGWKRPDSFLVGRPIEIIQVTPPTESSELTSTAQEHIAQAQLAADRGNTAEAVAALQAASALCPRHVDLLITLGNFHFELGDYSASFKAHTQALHLRRHDPLLHVLLANTAIRLERVEEFERMIGRALELDANFGPAHRLLGDLNLREGRFEEAAQAYGCVINQQPDDVSLLMSLGRCLAEVGQTEAAEACFQRIVELDPENETARHNLEMLRTRALRSAPSEPALDPRLETIGCPFCQSRQARQVRRAADIVTCDACQTVYLRTRPRKEIMEQIYQSYADEGSHMALPKTVAEADGSGLKRDYFLKEILEFIPPAGRLLDVGCGWGAFLLNGRQKGFEVSGLEITRKSAGYANQALEIPVKTSQFLETDYAPGSHSLITMLHVFEHLPYPREALEKVFQTLQPGGMFCGIVPNFDSFCSQALGERWYWLDPNYHYVHYTPATLQRHLEAAGFIVERIVTTTGDYGAEPIQKLLAQQNPAHATPAVFHGQLKQIEAEGRGEEIRFFARKPAHPAACEILELTGGESLTEPLVSVVISTCNAEQFLRTSLQNLTRQTIFPQIEVIVVDSGSQENERAIALEFAGRHPNIRYVRTGNETLYGAWNRGLAVARGRYWANLNTDDSLRDDALAILVAALEKHADCALAYADNAWTTQPNDTFPSAHIVKTVKYRDYAPIDTLFYCISGCLQFWRSSSLRELGGFDASLHCAGDYEVTLRMMEARMNAVHVPEVLSLFYQNRTGLTQANDRADREHTDVMNRSRARLNIGTIFQLPSDQPTAQADAWAVLGLHSSRFTVPWETEPAEHTEFAFSCLHRALAIDPENKAAGTSLVVLSHRLKRLDHEQENLIRRWPKMREWIHCFRLGEAAHLPLLNHAVIGPVYRPAEWSHRPTAGQLAGEPEALRPWICRVDGRHVYLSEEIYQRPAGLRHRPEELEVAGKNLVALLAQLPPFHAHVGGAGDALLLLASFYDQHPDGIVFSHPNNIPATRALLDAFPKLSKIYFLPQHTDPFFHIVLRYALHELPNCLGAGATPQHGYDEDWKPGLDVEAVYGVKKSPAWAAAMKQNAGSLQVAVAPKGSLSGMVGSKQNIILPELWAEVIAHIQERGFSPVLLGMPSEARDYPALPGCLDARAESFSGQMQRIGGAAGLVGADSWAKTFSALAGIPTIVFDPVKGADLTAWKDPSDAVFIDPWPAIQVVRSLDEYRQAFDVRIAQIAPSPAPARPVVAWEGSFLDYGSLSHINRELTARLSRALDLTCVGSPSSTSAPTDPRLQRCATQMVTQAPANLAVTVRHQWPPNWSKPASGALVVIQPWEYGALPRAWVACAANVDEFWVPTPLVRGMYLDSGIAPEKVRVMPNGVDTQTFRPGVKPLPLPTSKKFKFLFVGGTIQRKGPDVLLEAFSAAFTAADDVCLVIKDFGGDTFYRGQTAQEAIRAFQNKPGAPEMVYLTEELTADAMPALYAACDCLVLPYRGEGFGMPVLEAMACGLPVIVTGGGATDFFASTTSGWIIPSQRVPLGDHLGQIPLAGQGWWLEPSRPHLVEILKKAFGHPEECRRRGANGRALAKRRFDWNDIAAAVSQRLQELANRNSSATTFNALAQAKRALATKPAPTPATPRKAEAARVANRPLSPHVPSVAVPAVPATPACAQLGSLAEARRWHGRKELQKAWESAVAAIVSRPFHPEAFLMLAEIAMGAGHAPTSRACAKRAAALAPDWKTPRQWLKKSLKGNTKSTWLTLPDQVLENKSAEPPRLTVCLITRNEERFLASCLKSVREVAHQIVVVDTGSTDRTVEIARAYGAEVHSFAWCDDFSAARNAALQHATGDWILILDADEELSPQAIEPLQRHLKNGNAIAYRLPIVDVGREAEGCHYVPRLFRNAPDAHYTGRIHEQLFPSLEPMRQRLGLENLLGNATLLHHGYAADVTHSRDKMERNLKLVRLALAETPHDLNLRMNLGLELTRAGDAVAGREAYAEAWALMLQQPVTSVPPELRETFLMQYAGQLMRASSFGKLLDLFTTPHGQAAHGNASLHFLRGMAALKLQRWNEAADQMRLCLRHRTRASVTTLHAEIHTVAPHHCLALALSQARRDDEAEQAFQAALKQEPGNFQVRLDYATFLFAGGNPVAALQELHQLAGARPDDVTIWQRGGKVALSQPEFLEVALDWTATARAHFPGDAIVTAQHAEALLLAGRAAEAHPLWHRPSHPIAPSHRAARLICELVGERDVTAISPAIREDVSREVLAWFHRLVAFGAEPVILGLASQIGALRLQCPEAAEKLAAVFAMAEGPALVA